jgi:ankyrin repeat protein
MSSLFKSLRENFKRVTDSQQLVDGLAASTVNKAVRANDFDRIDVLLGRGYSLAAYNLKGETAFHEAIRAGSTTMAKFLIDRGADPLQPCQGAYQNPIHVAIAANQPRMISFLKALGAPLDEFSENGLAPLHHAVNEEKADVIKALIRAGADPVLRTKTGRTATMMAISSNKTAALQAVLSEPLAHKSFQSSYYKKFNNLEPPLGLAIQLGRIEAIEAMIDAGLGVNHRGKNNKTPLHSAVEYKNTDLMLYFLKKGADVNKARNDAGQTPLHMLCSMRMLTKAQDFFATAFDHLINYGSDSLIQDDAGYSSLYYLVNSAEMTTARFQACLETTTADINSYYAPEGEMALAEDLLNRGDVACLEQLLTHKRIAIDERYGHHQQTLIHMAVSKDQPEMTEMLLRYKPDLMVTDINGETVLDIANRYQNQSKAAILIKAQPRASDDRPKPSKPRRPKPD